jgi:hypothetical protein
MGRKRKGDRTMKGHLEGGVGDAEANEKGWEKQKEKKAMGRKRREDREMRGHVEGGVGDPGAIEKGWGKEKEK